MSGVRSTASNSVVVSQLWLPTEAVARDATESQPAIFPVADNYAE
jgi:hypothetical protein